MPLGTEIGLGPGHIVLDGDPSPPKRTHRQFSSHDYNCRQAARWIKIPYGTKVSIGPGHVVLGGDPAPPPRKGAQPPQFSAHIYCGQTVAHLSYCWALVCFWFSSLLFCFFFGSVRQIKLAIHQLLGARKYSVPYRIVFCQFACCTSSKMCRSSSAMSLPLSGPAFYGIEFSTRAFLVPLFPLPHFQRPRELTEYAPKCPMIYLRFVLMTLLYEKKTKRRNFEHNGNPLRYTEVCIKLTSYFVLCHCILCILCVACCRSEILLLLFFDPGIQFPGKKACYAKKNVKLERSLLLLLHKTVLE